MRAVEFYILLALSKRELHRYALKSVIWKDSLGSLNVRTEKIYLAAEKLENEALIELVDKRPVGKQNKPRLIYGLTPHGHLRLREEFIRLNHAVEIMKNAGFGEPQSVDFDLQRVLLDLEISAHGR